MPRSRSRPSNPSNGRKSNKMAFINMSPLKYRIMLVSLLTEIPFAGARWASGRQTHVWWLLSSHGWAASPASWNVWAAAAAMVCFFGFCFCLSHFSFLFAWKQKSNARQTENAGHEKNCHPALYLCGNLNKIYGAFFRPSFQPRMNVMDKRLRVFFFFFSFFKLATLSRSGTGVWDRSTCVLWYLI